MKMTWQTTAGLRETTMFEKPENIMLFKAELTPEKKIVVTLGTQQEFFLALALRKAAIAVDNILVENELKDEVAKHSNLVLPDNVLKTLR